MTANKTITSIKKARTGQLTGVPMVVYLILVLLGILGNALVMLVVGSSIIRQPGGGRNSDMILVNMALSNLLVSVMRNTLLVTSDFGLEVQMGCFCVGGRWGLILMFTLPLMVFRRFADYWLFKGHNCKEIIRNYFLCKERILCYWNFKENLN